jgi:hypothetical protein
MRIAQISLSFSGGFWPSSFPLFHGIARRVVLVTVSMNGSSVEGRDLHGDPARRALVDRKQKVQKSKDIPGSRTHVVQVRGLMSPTGRFR